MLIITALVTWYAKQQYNNPFAPRPCIEISGRGNKAIYIHCFTKIGDKKQTILVFLLPIPGTHSKNDLPVTIPQTEMLVTINKPENISEYIKVPPAYWCILKEKSLNGSEDTTVLLPEKWPTPAYTNNITVMKRLTVGYVYPFSDTIPTIHLSYSGIEIMFLTNTKFLNSEPDTNKLKLFREKFDIVITPLFTEQALTELRKIIRPQYFINFVTRGKKKKPALSNVIQANTKSYSLFIKRDIYGKIHMKNSLDEL